MYVQDLTQRKAAMADCDAVTQDAVGQAHIKTFARQVFLGADNDDRAGNATR